MEVVASILGGLVVETGRLFFGCIHSTIKNAVKFRANLDALEDELINQTELAMRKGKVPGTPVTEWIKKVDEFLPKVHQIKAVNLPRHSLNFSKRNRISKKVAEMLKEIERLILAGGSHLDKVAVSCSAPTLVEHIPGPPIRDQTMASTMLAKTMTLLSDDGVGIIGVWGMGGIGKTTLVRNLNNELKNTSMRPFSIVIWVTVSRNSDVSKVQREIAARLNLGARMGESVERMAIRLHHRLEEEKFLLILDDVWEKLDLDSLGIPRPEVQKGSKIILTSRFLDVCRYMMTDVELKVDFLDDEEAWQLFTRHAGNVVSLEHIRPFAEAITRECCGLPLAIIIVGAAMRGKTMVQLWEHALYELQRSVPSTGSVEDKVYKPLKWSYDSLEGKNKKPCFLYCALFPEDFSIEISELVWCWRAEGLIDEQENYEDSFNRGIALIENLKDSCLLEDGARQGTVKMHDVVRDVAIWISSSSEDGCKSLVRSGISLSEISAFEPSNSLKRVSFMKNKIIRLPDCVLQCSGALTLLLQGNPPLDRIPERFLQGFEALRVLNMSGTRIQSLPLSLLQLGDLRALFLRECFSLEELPSLEGLSRLEVLDLSATPIGELPEGTGNLSNLRQLNLSRTGLLKTIPAGILSRLSCLEVLDMTLSGYQLRVKRVEEMKQASFEELGCLERLLALCIRLKRIPCPDPEDFSWINRLKRFQLFIGQKPSP
ncbi:hypothetical protein I3842_11G180500 [Carya illinoinensis]|uniref:AAA+ ATPase domain-containing protein n=1 Tax=Carya illinoinensis TaxID=32201 RepID=A0A922DRQ5_CARIL|nr:hypothetical protein I3842_11G180500 [Carya illinoinensis]